MGHYDGWQRSAQGRGSRQHEEDPSLWDLVRADDAEGLRVRLGRAEPGGVASGVNACNAKGWTPLHLAAMAGSAAAADALLACGADASLKSGYLSPTALHLAAWNGHAAVARVLLDRGASPLETNGLGELAIEKAHQRGKLDLERLLLERGSPPAARVQHVTDKHAVTALASAAARAAESDRPDAMFFDPLAHRLATEQGREYGGGMSWILTPRTVIGDRFLEEHFWDHGVRQAVLLGAGMDARAYRLGLPQMRFFEVDTAAIFDVKEPLLCGLPLDCRERRAVPLDLREPPPALYEALIAAGFDPSSPSCWLLEGIVMYLKPAHVEALFSQIARLAAPGSAVVHDAVSATSQQGGITCCGARFLSGSDDYAGMWGRHGFAADVLNFDASHMDRRRRSVDFDSKWSAAPPEFCRGRPVTMFVWARKRSQQNTGAS